jgi:putative transposase
MDLWAYRTRVQIAFSRTGKPADNAFLESFNEKHRVERLDALWFTSLTEAQRLYLSSTTSAGRR